MSVSELSVLTQEFSKNAWRLTESRALEKLAKILVRQMEQRI